MSQSVLVLPLALGTHVRTEVVARHHFLGAVLPDIDDVAQEKGRRPRIHRVHHPALERRRHVHQHGTARVAPPRRQRAQLVDVTPALQTEMPYQVPLVAPQQMQAERVAGFREFVEDVRAGSFPGPGHVIKAPDGLIDSFLELLDQQR